MKRCCVFFCFLRSKMALTPQMKLQRLKSQPCRGWFPFFKISISLLQFCLEIGYVVLWIFSHVFIASWPVTQKQIFPLFTCWDGHLRFFSPLHEVGASTRAWTNVRTVWRPPQRGRACRGDDGRRRGQTGTDGGRRGGSMPVTSPRQTLPTSAPHQRLGENSFPRQLFTRCLFNSFLIECA